MQIYVYYSIVFFSIIIIFLYFYILWEKIYEIYKNNKRKRYLDEILELVDTSINTITSTGNVDSVDIRLFSPYFISNMKMKIIEDRLIYYIENFKDIPLKPIIEFVEKLGLVDMQINCLLKNNMHTKALACKTLGEMRSKKAIKYIMREVKSPSSDIQYNALLALAKIGDEIAFTYAFNSITSSIFLNERSLIEIIQSFEGDKKYVYNHMINCENDLLSCIFIKSAVSIKDSSLGENISKFLSSSSAEKKIASIKALSSMEDKRYIHDIAECLKNKNWEIRAVAAKALGLFGDSSILASLTESLSDSQWFVRYNSAQSILLIDKDLRSLPSIFNGNDKFAKDIIAAEIENLGFMDKITSYKDSQDINKRQLCYSISKYIKEVND
jgi:hypothetical protein